MKKNKEKKIIGRPVGRPHPILGPNILNLFTGYLSEFCFYDPEILRDCSLWQGQGFVP